MNVPRVIVTAAMLAGLAVGAAGTRVCCTDDERPLHHDCDVTIG